MTPLPKGEDDYIIQAATLQTCPSKEYGDQLTEQLRAMGKDHAGEASYQIALSRAEILYGDPLEARSRLGAAAVSGKDEFEAAFLIGRSYYEEAQKGGNDRDELMSQARQQFAAAYRLNKLDAPTLYYLSRTLADNGDAPSQSVINASTGAALLAPGVADYAVNAAMVNLRAGDREMAARVMKPFASDPHNPSYAARVSAMIEAIEANKELDEVIAALNAKDEEQ
jgi:hypothetical protein